MLFRRDVPQISFPQYSGLEDFSEHEISVFKRWEFLSLGIDETTNFESPITPSRLVEQLQFSDPRLRALFLQHLSNGNLDKYFESQKNDSRFFDDCLDLRQKCAKLEALAYIDLPRSRKLTAKFFTQNNSASDDFQFRKLRSLFGIASKTENKYKIIRLYSFDSERLKIPSLSAFSSRGNKVATNKSASIMAAVEGFATINRCSISENSIVLKRNKFYVSDPGADPVSGFVSGQWHSVAAHPLNPHNALISKSEGTIRNISEAVSGLGKVNSNYWHQLIEYLPGTINTLKKTDVKQFFGVPKLLNPSRTFFFSTFLKLNWCFSSPRNKFMSESCSSPLLREDVLIRL